MILAAGVSRRMPLSRRNQLLTDEAVQGELLFRAITYWFFCLLVVSLFVVGWSMYFGPPRPFSVIIQNSLVQFAPALLGSIVLLPIVLIDVVQVSSRFVGPIQRVRNVLRKAAAGEPTPALALRKDDFWQDLAQYANQVVATQSMPAVTGNEDDLGTQAPFTHLVQ